MNANPTPGTSMLGALLVAEGLIAPEQLAACLLLQQYDYSHLPLGQILLRCGYISPENLEHALHLQGAMRDSLNEALEAQMPISADVSVLVIASQPSDVLTALLTRLGASVRYCHIPPDDIESLRPDLVLVQSERVPFCNDLPAWCLVGLLPPGTSRHLYPDAARDDIRKLIERYIRKARDERARHLELEENRQHISELHTLATVTRSISSAATAQDLLGRLMGLVRDLLLVEAATLFRVDTKNNCLVFEVVLGPNQRALTHKTLSIDHGIAGWVARHGEPLIIPDVNHDRRFAVITDHVTGFQTHSMICVPMSVYGKVRGVLQLINKQDGEFTERDLHLLRIIAAFGALALAGKSSLAIRSAAMRERALSEIFGYTHDPVCFGQEGHSL
jgi:putative methionine-R-sulfoxide reductase with GAF domain